MIKFSCVFQGVLTRMKQICRRPPSRYCLRTFITLLAYILFFANKSNIFILLQSLQGFLLQIPVPSRFQSFIIQVSVLSCCCYFAVLKA